MGIRSCAFPEVAERDTFEHPIVEEDRRSSHRVEAEMPVTFEVARKTYFGTTANLSDDGMMIESSFARKNIQINTVCPGPTDTPLFADFAGEGEQGAKLREGLARAIPMKRLGQPADYPGIICFLASSDADYITGQTISVSGGLTMHG